MINLYPHQEKVINQARGALRSRDSVLIQAPTGFGKTVLASFMASQAASRGLVCWFVCHRAELIFQTSQTFDQCGIQHGFIAAGYPINPARPVQLCSINSLSRRLDKIKRLPDLVIWDEAHHIAAGGWANVKSMLPKAKHVGLSATPQRLDGSGLDHFFDFMVPGPSVSWLIENGYLSKYKIYAPSAPDLSGARSKFGDFKRDDAEAAMDKPTLTGDIIKHWKKYAWAKKTICFATSVKHSLHIAGQFNENGVLAVHLDGKTPKELRRKACQAFASGKIDVLCNVDLFGEGFDIAAQAQRDVTVEAVIQARPTQSLALHLQQVGRALRRKSEPAIILDHAGNCFRHGLPDDDREWSLEGSKNNTKNKNQDPDIAIKQCPKCFNIHRPAPSCSQCGHVYEIIGRIVEETDGELEELDPATLRKREQSEVKSLDQLIELGVQRGYKHPAKWAAHVYTARKRR